MYSKDLLVENLVEMSELVDHRYKKQAYHHAAEVLENMPEEEYETRSTFIDIYGIGKGINEKVLTFRVSGHIAKLDELRQESAETLDPRLYKVRKSYITKRIPLAQASKYIEEVKSLNTLGVELWVAGSVRRQKALIADIDMVCLAKDEETYNTFLDILGSHYNVISRGGYKASFMLDRVNNIQLDIILTNKEELPFQMLYLTGSKDFNLICRRRAKDLGLKLNQVGLFNRETEEPVEDLTSEKDVLEYLGMRYVEPKNR